MNTARAELRGAGIITSGLVFGGTEDPPAVNNTETWNGTNWTEVNNLNSARQSLGASGPGGTNTAALAFGGTQGPQPSRVAVAELWNGTNWTEQDDLNAGRYANGGSGGGSTNALSFGGRNVPNTIIALTEEWTGAGAAVGAWATGGNLNTGRYGMGGLGIYTAALSVGGRNPGAGNGVGNTESYDGTSWTELNDLNTARHSLMTSATSSTAALAFGGEDASRLAVTESWNGTNWTEVNDLNTARGEGGGAGTSTAALAFSGATNPTTRVTNTESWNGTNWTEVNDVNNARFQTLTGLGQTNTAALLVGGRNPPSSILTNTENWNGTNWTEVNDLNLARFALAGQTGTNTSSLAVGGSTPAPATTANTEDWNGVSWQETSNLNTARQSLGGAGTTSNAVVFGGSPNLANTEEWNSPSNVVKTLTD